jgi:uncharacterized protein YbcI
MSTDELSEQTAEERGGSLLREISTVMVQLHKDQFGRGPTKARTNWAGPDMLVCILEDTLTPAERNLIEMGEHQRLRDMRMFFQYASLKEFCEPIQNITGRKVRAFMSAIDTGAGGIVSELFMLHPEGYDGPSRIQIAAHEPGESPVVNGPEAP